MEKISLGGGFLRGLSTWSSSSRFAILVAGLGLWVCASLTPAYGQQLPPECGSLANGYGPYDYRTHRSKLGVVEKHHFTSSVENLRAGQSSAYVGGDIDYTLRASPNHHRALMALIRLEQKEKTQRPRGMNFPVECYFQRGERFQPTDGTVKMIYGMYLSQKGRTGDALGKLEQARALGANDANLHYNLGLVYFNLGRFDEALASAHRAYALGFPLPGLRNMLTRNGHWRDPGQARQ